jgi:ABC-type phosphate/phosphonate transport system permease subunit
MKNLLKALFKALKFILSLIFTIPSIFVLLIGILLFGLGEFVKSPNVVITTVKAFVLQLINKKKE